MTEPYFSQHFAPPVTTAAIKKLNSTVRHRLFIDNRDRRVGGDAFKFEIVCSDLGLAPYMHVTSVTLAGVSIPKIEGEDYCVLQIDELSDNQLDVTMPSISKAFALIYFDSSSMATGQTKPRPGVDIYQKQLLFSPPLNKLDKLTISVLKHDGSVMTTSDVAGSNRMSMVLEITTTHGRMGA